MKIETEILVISNSPARDIQEFVNWCSEYVVKYNRNRVILKDGNTLIFHHNHNLKGIRRYYSYSEIFTNYLKNSITNLKQRISEAVNDLSKIEDDIINGTIIGLNQFCPRFNQIALTLMGDNKEL